ncbi:MAG: DUF2480 family protein [Flavobacteriaceae bacterium]|nr:DUF2480 family protein [Flavobacteriaceae bacterium]
MSGEIKNRIADSKLITIDLENFYPEGDRVLLDIKKWLFAEQILKEKDFRAFIKDYQWEAYQDKYVALYCSTEAIIPSWAYLLITVSLSPFAKKIIVGNLEQLETSIFQDIINNLSLEKYQGKPIIIKGCASKPIPETVYTQLVSKLISITKSIMYGEACSNVPLFKSKK